MKKIAVEVKNLVVSYKEIPVLWDINLKIPKGCLFAIVGPNGAGKTTLLKAMLDLIKADAGFVNIDKTLKVSYVPQNSSVSWDFPATCFDVVLMGSYRSLGWIKRPGRKEKNNAAACLEKMGMLEFKDRQINELSGGQKQRVFLARALMEEGDIFFLDEPFRGVDVVTEKEIIRLLKSFKEEGKTAVLVHHDLSTLCEYFDYMALINKSLIAQGPCSEVLLSEKLTQAYNGKISPFGVGYANIASNVR